MLAKTAMRHDSLSLYERHPRTNPVSIISIPTELGSDARGLAETPEYLFRHGLEHMLTSVGVTLGEKISIPCPTAPAPSVGRLKNLSQVAEVARASAAASEAAARQGDVVLALGGDHSAAIGTIAGAARAYSSLGVIYIDAHPDINTPESTLTGNIHGMNTAILTGFGPRELTELARPLAPKHFLHIGIKDIDPLELEFLRERHAPVTMFDVASRGLAPALSAVDTLMSQVENIWVSMDIDSIDRGTAPGVAMPSDGGFTKREILSLAQYIGHRADLVGLDIVEMVPGNDIENKTAYLALELIAKFFGGEYDSYHNYIDTYEHMRVKENAPGVTRGQSSLMRNRGLRG